MQSRREFSSFLAALAITLGSFPVSVAKAQPNLPTVPDETLLESGDFVFPKKRGEWVPYIDRGTQQLSTPTEDETEWDAAKQKFLTTAKEKFPYFSDQDIEAIRRLSLQNSMRRMSAP